MPREAHRLEQLALQLKDLSDALNAADASSLPPARTRQVRKTITEASDKLRKILADLDPIKRPNFVFDPSNPTFAGRLVAITMIAQPRKPLEKIERFYGSGVYALYYNGNFEPYRPISKREQPIYVGKADPAEPASKTAEEQGDRLARRLADHCRTISQAKASVQLKDFEYRALVVQTGWQTPAEDYLIHLFKPIWNSEMDICYGFGKHGDDPDTRANLRSPWDTIHPGRDWAHRDPRMKDARPKKRILDEIRKHFAHYPPVASTDQILRKFLEEMQAAS
jgi:hypothetical protein